MPDPISTTTPSVQGTQSATFDRIESPPTQEPPQDMLDISITEGDSAPASFGSQTYSPATMTDRFRFEIQNGMFNRSLSINAMETRFDSEAVNTHKARASVIGQMAQGAQSALFALQYNAAQPNRENATTHIDAKTEQNRQFDQNLNLLNML